MRGRARDRKFFPTRIFPPWFYINGEIAFSFGLENNFLTSERKRITKTLLHACYANANKFITLYRLDQITRSTAVNYPQKVSGY